MVLISTQTMSTTLPLRRNLEFSLESPSGCEKAEPFIKWAGGKQSLLGQLLPHFPREFGRYFEPFIGGGAVFFATRHPRATIADRNDWLIDTFEAIRDDWQLVAQRLDRLTNSKTEYLRIRTIQPSSLSTVDRAAHFIYLNKTCFRGLFRVNRKGEFNVPYGAYDRRYYDPRNLSAASDALQNVIMLRGDFEAGLISASQGDFCYLDPPYYKLGGHSDFNRYTAGQFREVDHLRLASVCNELTARGVKWAMSNSDTPFIRDLYRNYRCVPITARREINLLSQSRTVSELLILNY